VQATPAACSSFALKRIARPKATTAIALAVRDEHACSGRLPSHAVIAPSE
jgi:hypothetical protein